MRTRLIILIILMLIVIGILIYESILMEEAINNLEIKANELDKIINEMEKMPSPINRSKLMWKA